MSADLIAMPQPRMRWCQVAERVVMLDLRTGEYLTMDPAGSAIWLELQAAEAGRQPAVPSPAAVERASRRVATRFGAPEDAVRREVIAFVERGERLGWWAQQAVPEALDGPAQPLRAARAWWALAGSARSLRRRGFARTWLQPHRQPPAVRDERLLAEGLAAFTRAENLMVLREAPRDCLPRSLGLYRFLRGGGLAVTQHLGVSLDPFSAHAWVQYGDRVLCDRREVAGDFVELLRR